MMRRKKLTVIGLVAVFALTLVVTGVMAQQGDVPPPPPWVNADGTVDLSKKPDRMPVADQTGRIVGWVTLPKADSPPGLADQKEFPVTNDRGEVVGYMKPDPSAPTGPLRFFAAP